MTEEWRVVAQAPNYEVSSLGRVRRVGRAKAARVGRILKGTPDKDGYLQVFLSTKQQVSTRKIHHLVLLAFVGPRPAKHEAAHDDGNPANNRADNLSWKTSRQNKADKLRHGTHGVKLKPEDVFAIRALRAQGRTLQSIGDVFNITKSTARKIAVGDLWRHA